MPDAALVVITKRILRVVRLGDGRQRVYHQLKLHNIVTARGDGLHTNIQRLAISRRWLAQIIRNIGDGSRGAALRFGQGLVELNRSKRRVDAAQDLWNRGGQIKRL